MGALRLVLIFANLVALAFAIYIVNREIAYNGRLEGSAFWGLSAILTGLGLNLLYLLVHQSLSSKARSSRLINLWLDAKENELRQRVDRSRRDK
jgi:hypothetical protein